MPQKLNLQVSLKQIVLKCSNHYNPQDLNSKSQQSQQFIQTSITSQKENATITKNILVYSYQQAVNWSPSILEVHNNKQYTSQEQIQQKKIECNDLSYQITSFFQEILGLLLKILKEFEKILLQYNDKTKLQNIIHQELLLVEQLQKLRLEIHKIFQRLLSMTGQSQKELGQHPKTEDDVVEQQLLNKKEQPFPFQAAQLIKIFEEFYKIREINKYQTAQFQQSLEIFQEKTEKTEQEIKDILQRLNKQVSENMQEQPHFEDEFDFNQQSFQFIQLKVGVTSFQINLINNLTKVS
ncbi:hypothetical protein ABPG72_020346 [Tetrahymena utriculariae]